MRVHAHLQHPQPAGPVVLPERLVPLHVPVAAEDVVDQNVEPALVALDARDQLGDRRGVFVIDHERRSGPARGRRSVSPVSSIVSGLPISDGPELRLLRPVA